MNIHIFDLDGTLVDSSHRYRAVDGRIDLQHWRDNSDKVMNDKPLPLAKKFRKLVQSPTDLVIIATARIACQLTKKYLEVFNLQPDVFIGRDENDNRKGSQLKAEEIRKLNLPNDASFYVYEDNDEYLSDLMREFNAVGHFFPSKQGH